MEHETDFKKKRKSTLHDAAPQASIETTGSDHTGLNGFNLNGDEEHMRKKVRITLEDKEPLSLKQLLNYLNSNDAQQVNTGNFLLCTSTSADVYLQVSLFSKQRSISTRRRLPTIQVCKKKLKLRVFCIKYNSFLSSTLRLSFVVPQLFSRMCGDLHNMGGISKGELSIFLHLVNSPISIRE